MLNRKKLTIIGIQMIVKNNIFNIHGIDAKLKELTGMRDTLSLLVKSCSGDSRPDCPILKDLAKAGA